MDRKTEVKFMFYADITELEITASVLGSIFNSDCYQLFIVNTNTGKCGSFNIVAERKSVTFSYPVPDEFKWLDTENLRIALWEQIRLHYTN